MAAWPTAARVRLEFVPSFDTLLLLNSRRHLFPGKLYRTQKHITKPNTSVTKTKQQVNNKPDLPYLATGSASSFRPNRYPLRFHVDPTPGPLLRPVLHAQALTSTTELSGYWATYPHHKQLRHPRKRCSPRKLLLPTTATAFPCNLLLWYLRLDGEIDLVWPNTTPPLRSYNGRARDPATTISCISSEARPPGSRVIESTRGRSDKLHC